MPRKVLVVDDNAINRQLLINTLGSDYSVMEAENGAEALSLLHKYYKVFSAVLLDVVMPEMDGYELLGRMRDNMLLAQIPVIMVTGSEDEESRVKALSLGANDFILKPFNPEIVRHCLKNNIALRETASILNAIQKDKLTGLFNREAFFEKVTAMISESESGYYMLSCFDIDNFKLINDQYGAAEGDRILREIGKAVQKNADEIGGIAGRLSADNFAALLPAHEKMTTVLSRIFEKKLVWVEQQAVSFSVGRYIITDTTLSASAIYDRAFIAKQSVKGRYDVHLAYFDDAMLDKLIRDQQITSEMEEALKNCQFEAWYQPQYNHATGALMGAEALARWRHPQKGIISPGEFIPLFEQNGFVYELDKYIWRDVCRSIRAWIDAGHAPVHISVNISRYDIFRPDLISVLTGLTEEYGIPVDMLHLEITESAFTESAEKIVSIVKELINFGFTVEIDDFGSGYSSLNTLKDVPAQVVKLDMRFLKCVGDSRRGGNILESIVRMTKWLGMTVLAEGVEERDEADFLMSIGCTYVQGYLYAKPMPACEFEKLLCETSTVDMPHDRLDENMLFCDGFWDPNDIDSVVFNKYAGAACVYEFHNDSIEMVRISEKYVRAVFGSGICADEVMRLDWDKHISEETAAELKQAVMESAEKNREVAGEYVFYDLPGCGHETHLRTALSVIASTDDRYLVYCTSVNITRQREAERSAEKTSAKLNAILNNMPGGVAVFEGSPDSPDKARITYFSDGLCKLLGYTRAEYKKLTDENPFGLVSGADLENINRAVNELIYSDTPVDIVYRATTKDGEVKWVSVKAVTGDRTQDGIVVDAVFSDVTELRNAIERLSVSEQVNRLAMQQSRDVVCLYDVKTRRLCVSPNMDKIFEPGSYDEDVPYKTVREGKVSPFTVDAYKEFYERILHGEKKGEVLFQRKSTLGWRWLEAHFTTIFTDEGKPATAVISYVDVTESVEKDAAYKKWKQNLDDKAPESFSLYHCNLTQNVVMSATECMHLPRSQSIETDNYDERTSMYAEGCIVPQDRAGFLSLLDRQALLESFYRGKRARMLEYREITDDGGMRYVRVTSDTLKAPGGNDVEAFIFFEDIDGDKRAQLAMMEMAEKDALTGILNRGAFAQKVDSIIAASKPGAMHALLMIDIDGFKLVNDSFGHFTGDKVLVNIASILTDSSRRSDLVGRLGGDEFAVFISNIPDRSAAGKKARQICSLTQKALERNVQISPLIQKALEHDVQISSSIGIALCPHDASSFAELYRLSDETLYRVKNTGKNSYAFYADGAHEKEDQQ